MHLHASKHKTSKDSFVHIFITLLDINITCKTKSAPAEAALQTPQTG